MNFDLSEEQVLLKEAVIRFLKDRYPLEERKRIAASPEGFSPGLWKTFAKGLGILGLRGTHVHCAGPDGVVDVPLQECLRAWRIPKFAPVPPEATIEK